MSKRNKRRFWQSQKAHLDYLMSGFKDIDLWDYHLETFRSQKYLGRILSREERRQIWMREVQP